MPPGRLHKSYVGFVLKNIDIVTGIAVGMAYLCTEINQAQPPFLRCGKNLFTMDYREIGKTGMKVSALSFGASSLGGVFHDIDESRAIEAVYAAVEGGMNFIDVSPYYGHYKAETVLGKALRGIDRGKYYLSTKVGRYGKDGVNTWDYSGRKARESVLESLDRIGVEHIDLINVHDIEFADLHQVAEETLPALVELRESGLVSHVGITDLQLENLVWVIEHVPAGTVESILNFCHFTLNDDKLADYLDYFEEKGIGVINASPLSMGLLSQRGVPSWHPAPGALVGACRKAVDFCRAQGYPIEKLAIQYSVSNPRIATTLFSSANPDNVRKNLAYVGEPADMELVRKVREIIGEQQRVSWKNS